MFECLFVLSLRGDVLISRTYLGSIICHYYISWEPSHLHKKLTHVYYGPRQQIGQRHRGRQLTSSLRAYSRARMRNVLFLYAEMTSLGYVSSAYCNFTDVEAYWAVFSQHVDGLQFAYTRQNGMYFVVMTRQNISPAVGIEMVTRVSQLVKDYCGVLTEEAIRKNLSLIYELLDEIMDYGHPQNTSTEQIKSYVLDEPVLVSKSAVTQSYSNTAHSSSANKSVISTDSMSGKNETFVDLFEQLTVLFNASGQLVRADLDGQVKLRCYVPGSPLFHMGFNEELAIRSEDNHRGPSGITFDDIVFHKSVSLEKWHHDRSVLFRPPEGEFNLMNYRMDVSNLPMPFKFATRFSTIGQELADLVITVQATLPDPFYGSSIVVKCPLPQATTSASFSFDVDDDEYERAEFSKSEKCATWYISKLRSGFTAVCHIKMVLEPPLHPHYKREFGPINMTFEAPMLLLSSLQVKFLRVSERNHTFSPERWIRAATTSTSYVARLDLTK